MPLFRPIQLPLPETAVLAAALKDFYGDSTYDDTSVC